MQGCIIKPRFSLYPATCAEYDTEFKGLSSKKAQNLPDNANFGGLSYKDAG